MFGLRLFTRRQFALLNLCSVIPFLILFLFAATNVCASAHDATLQANFDTQKSPAAGKISGHIYRADTGAPLAKTQVALLPVTGNSLNVTGERRFTLTDGEGFYSFAQVTAGTYTVAAKRDGFVGGYFDDVPNPVNAQILKIAADETLSKIDIHLVTAGVISGTVLDEDNQPLQSVGVEAVRIQYLRGGRQIEVPRGITRTDDLGNFRLFNLRAGNYFVRVETSDVNPQTEHSVDRIVYYPNTMDIESAQPLKVSAGNEISGIRFSVGPAASFSVTGNIIDVSGSAGQRQYTITADRLNTGDSGRPSTTSVGGSFTLHGIMPGEYLLRAASTILGPTTQLNGQPREVSGAAIARVSDGDTRVNIQVGPQVEVSGRVSIENSPGKTASGILVALWPESTTLGSSNNETDRNGAFKIQYVTSGSYDLATFDTPGMYMKEVLCNGKDYTLLPLTVEPGVNVSDCVLVMATDVVTVKGQVLDGDKPVPGWMVVAIPEQRSLRHLERFMYTKLTNLTGEYQLSGMIPGDYLLFAVPPDENETYFDINFADRNLQFAERVSLKTGETKTVGLKPTVPQ
jgi:5-hydroxyisourate hydrolase-like protein (transthyretin family)